MSLHLKDDYTEKRRSRGPVTIDKDVSVLTTLTSVSSVPQSVTLDSLGRDVLTYQPRPFSAYPMLDRRSLPGTK